MTKYEELASIACRQSKEAFIHRDECRNLASKIGYGYKAYLEIPEEHFNFVKLDAGLNVIESKCGNYIVEMTQDFEGFWWFGFHIHYQDSKERTFLDQVIKIGLKKSKTKFTVRMDNDECIDPVSDEELEKLFQSIYESDKRSLSQKINQPKYKIGFTE